MICENAYYLNGTGENRERLHCKREEVINDDFTRGKCPLIYWCPISERYENTVDMFNCRYREKNDGKNDN
jgi:hypothetical protein